MHFEENFENQQEIVNALKRHFPIVYNSNGDDVRMEEVCGGSVRTVTPVIKIVVHRSVVNLTVL